MYLLKCVIKKLNYLFVYKIKIKLERNLEMFNKDMEF